MYLSYACLVYLQKFDGVPSDNFLFIMQSGAVMGILGFVCTQFPDTYLTIIFLPIYKFTAGMVC